MRLIDRLKSEFPCPENLLAKYNKLGKRKSEFNIYICNNLNSITEAQEAGYSNRQILQIINKELKEERTEKLFARLLHRARADAKTQGVALHYKVKNGEYLDVWTTKEDEEFIETYRQFLEIKYSAEVAFLSKEQMTKLEASKKEYGVI